MRSFGRNLAIAGTLLFTAPVGAKPLFHAPSKSGAQEQQLQKMLGDVKAHLAILRTDCSDLLDDPSSKATVTDHEGKGAELPKPWEIRVNDGKKFCQGHNHSNVSSGYREWVTAPQDGAKTPSTSMWFENPNLLNLQRGEDGMRIYMPADDPYVCAITRTKGDDGRGSEIESVATFDSRICDNLRESVDNTLLILNEAANDKRKTAEKK